MGGHAGLRGGLPHLQSPLFGFGGRGQRQAAGRQQRPTAALSAAPLQW